ncbi:MAG: fimbrillin family protein [Bacteroidales bacterium]|nr:fimbrillin family protein [Bacteroidales bacterium]
MKKFFFLAVAAVVALAACTKNEADKTSFEKSRQISFSTIAGKATKTPLSGTIYKTTDPTFGVFCYALTNGKNWTANSADGQAYMDKIEISYNSTDKIWEPASTYYWPLSGSLTFTGFSPYTEASKVAYAPATKAMTVTGYVAAATTAAQTDLMWANTQKDLTDNQSTYTSESATSTLKGVNMVFHHALSQVKFFVKKAAGLDDYTVTVNSITFNAMSTGTLTVTDDSPVWGAATVKADYDSEGADVVAPNNSAAFAVVGNANMMVPQTLTAANPLVDNDQKFVITYSLEKSGVDLGQKAVTVALRTTDVTAWEQNKIYNYNIVIDLNKIYFNPTMVDWVNADPQPTEITVK